VGAALPTPTGAAGAVGVALRRLPGGPGRGGTAAHPLGVRAGVSDPEHPLLHLRSPFLF